MGDMIIGFIIGFIFCVYVIVGPLTDTPLDLEAIQKCQDRGTNIVYRIVPSQYKCALPDGSTLTIEVKND